MMNYFKIIGLLFLLIIGQDAFAQTLDQVDAQVEQNSGNFPAMNLDYMGINALGMTQKAWLDPLRNMGEGQVKPAYSNYVWSNGTIMPIRLRIGMATIVNFPDWEYIQDQFLGDGKSFILMKIANNKLLLQPNPKSPVGLDSNLVVIGRSGNKYVFYLRSETVNTERLTHLIVDIEVSESEMPSGAGAAGGIIPASLSGSVPGSVGGRPFGATESGENKETANGMAVDDQWLNGIPVDPEKFKFDIEIYAPNPDDVEIAPERVWRDDIFTYIDLGPKALNMLQRPIVNLIVQKSEVPVGFRTRGKYGRLIVVEAVGDMVLRNGQSIICLKVRKDPARGIDTVEYDNKAITSWDVPTPTVTVNNPRSGGALSGRGVSDPFAPNEKADELSIERRLASAEGGQIDSPPIPGSSYSRGTSTISIEISSDRNVENLEKLWATVFGTNSDVLDGYEPYFSVDAPAEGGGGEMFHLRVGPVESVREGDILCDKLGRRGVSCSVVRTQ